MEITLTYSDLQGVADGAASSLIKERENGLFAISHSYVKTFAKVLLWLMLQSDEVANSIVEQLSDDLSVQDLYCQLEEKGELEISKKDLSKYKFYIDSIYSVIKAAEAMNQLKVQSALLEQATQTKAIAEVLNNLGEQIASLDEETLKEKTQEVDDLLKSISNKN